MVVQGNVTLMEIEHPPELSTTERILAAVNFPTDSLVYATWMNRVQNRAYFQLCDVDSLLPNCTIVSTSSSSLIEGDLTTDSGYSSSFDSPLCGETPLFLSLFLSEPSQALI